MTSESGDRSLRGLAVDVTRQLGVLMFVKGSGLVTTLVLSRTVGVTGLGIWASISAAAALLSVIGGAGLYQAIIQFYPRVESDEQRARILRSSATVVALCSAGLGVTWVMMVGLGGARFEPFDLRLAVLTAVLGILFAVRLLLTNHFRARGQLRAYSRATVAAEVIELVACTVSAFVFRDVVLVAICVCVGLLGFCVVLWLSALRGTVGGAPELPIRTLLGYGVPLAGTQVADTLLARGDRLIVGNLLGGAATGIYAATYALVSVPAVLSSAMTTVIFPRLAAKFWSSGTERRMRLLSLSVYSAVSLVLLVLLTVLSAPLLRIVANVDPSLAGVNSELLFLLTGAGVCFFGAARIIGVELFVRQKTGRTALIWSLAAASNVCLNLVLVPVLALTGAGLANLLSYLAFLLLMIGYVRFSVRGERG